MHPEDRHPLRAAAAQRGQVIIMMVLMLALATGFLVFTLAESRPSDATRNKRTDTALALARDALIGRAWADPNHPGSMPCPDAVNTVNHVPGDGIADLLVGTNCPSYIGRLPWKTLDLPELTDGDGEPLWYMLSPAFKDGTNPINTDTLSNLTVYAGDNTTVLASQVVAVVFAPGAPIGAQVRSPTQTAACPVTGTTVAQSMCASNYLETLSGVNNASATGPFISGAPSATFNDRLVLIDNIDLMTPVEARAATAMLQALIDYRNGSEAGSGCKCYPYADVSDGTANWGLTYGRVPLINADSTGIGINWSDYGVVIPQWLLDNDWRKVFFYAVAPSKTYAGGAGSLTVDGATGKDIVLISTGAATAPRSVMPDDYVEDAENRNLDNVYVTPADVTSKNRDRLYWYKR
jgi:hypothetical protein